MNFVKVIKNNPECMQALFEHNDKYYMYSHVNNKHADETMVFSADENGDISNWLELMYHPGYLSTDSMMKKVEDGLG